MKNHRRLNTWTAFSELKVQRYRHSLYYVSFLVNKRKKLKHYIIGTNYVLTDFWQQKRAKQFYSITFFCKIRSLKGRCLENNICLLSRKINPVLSELCWSFILLWGNSITSFCHVFLRTFFLMLEVVTEICWIDLSELVTRERRNLPDFFTIRTRPMRDWADQFWTNERLDCLSAREGSHEWCQLIGLAFVYNFAFLHFLGPWFFKL